jgi:hypothetical protein
VNQTENNPTQNENEVTLEDVTMVGDNETSQQTTDNEKGRSPTPTTSQTKIFLQKRTIPSVIPQQKKRKSNYFSVTGNVAKKTNVEYLKEQKLESDLKMKKKVTFKPPFKSTKAKKSSKSADSEHKSSTIKRKASVSKGKTKTKCVKAKKIKTESETAKFDNHITDVRPITSGTNCRGGPIPLDSDNEMSSQYSDDNEPPCCVCNKKSPDSIHQLAGIVFVKWAQCDQCQHWTHLEFCCKTRLLRRGDSFFCTHCEE